jgi:uncharacterized protein YjdB
VWTSSNTAIATVNQQGKAKGIATGQVEIKAAYNAAAAKALLTVVSGNDQIATITIDPPLKEIKLNESATLNAIAKNTAGMVLQGKIFSWETDNAALVEINAATGAITAKSYGTANIEVSSGGIKSSQAMVQVIRNGAFASMASTGIAKLKIENGVLKLQTTADFGVSTSPPDLRIYLGNNSNNITEAVEVASLNQRSGTQSWNVPTAVSITQYRYVIVWCKQFGGVYGLADLGN